MSPAPSDNAFIENLNFPRPFIIACSMLKGGVGKTWIALNFATWLALRGYRVLLIDGNPSPDCFKDVVTLVNGERDVPPQDLPLDVRLASRAGEAEMHIASGQYDFVVIDTAQSLDRPTSEYAWRNCHLMISPITYDSSDHFKFLETVDRFAQLREMRVPIFLAPIKAVLLKNQRPFLKFVTFIKEIKDKFPAVVHLPAYDAGFNIDNNSNFMSLEHRCVYASDAQSVLKEGFLVRVQLLFEAILHTIQEVYGAAPPPPGTNLSAAATLHEEIVRNEHQ